MAAASPIVTFAAWWCLLQAIGVSAWWLTLAWHAPLRSAFIVPGSAELTLFAFVLPDVLLGVVGGVAACIGLRGGRTWGRDALLLVTGAMGYAALYCLVVALAGGGWWGAALMVPSLVVLPWLCWRVPG